MKELLVADIAEGEALRDTFLVTRKDTRETKHGKPYLSLELADNSGRIEARVWERAERFTGQFNVGDYVLIEGRAESFQGNLQLNVNHLERLDPNSVERSLFLPAVKEDIEVLFSQLLQTVDSIADEQLRALVKEIVTDGEVARGLRRSPAAQSVHHAKLGGLLQHTSSMLLLGLRFAEHYRMLDRDMLIAGIVLHDLGKLDELNYDSNFEFSEPGRLLGHITLGVARIDRAAARVKIDQRRLELVKHIVLSHHGEHEFGSPVLPATSEALLVHFLDNIDSKLNIISGQIETDRESPGSFTAYNRYMGRSFYKGPAAESKPYGVNWPWDQGRDKAPAERGAKAEHRPKTKTPGLFDKQD